MIITLITQEEFKNRTQYWNRYYHLECPICNLGSTEIERVLVADEPRPSGYWARHIVEERACASHRQ